MVNNGSLTQAAHHLSQTLTKKEEVEHLQVSTTIYMEILSGDFHFGFSRKRVWCSKWGRSFEFDRTSSNIFFIITLVIMGGIFYNKYYGYL